MWKPSDHSEAHSLNQKLYVEPHLQSDNALCHDFDGGASVSTGNYLEECAEVFFHLIVATSLDLMFL